MRPISNYINEIARLQEESGIIRPYIFRGQQSFNSPLISSLKYQKDKLKMGAHPTTFANLISAKTYEYILLQEFKKNSYNFKDELQISSSDNIYEWFSVMRHFGFPSRLIDWTTNPLVALFFAISDIHSNDVDDGVVFVNGHFPGMNSLIRRNDEIGPSFIGSKPAPKIFDTDTNIEYIIYEPTRRFPRIVAQNGMFVVQRNIELDLFETTQEGSKFKKIKIHKDDKLEIFNELDTLGINNKTLFPDLSGASKYTIDIITLNAADFIQRYKDTPSKKGEHLITLRKKYE